MRLLGRCVGAILVAAGAALALAGGSGFAAAGVSQPGSFQAGSIQTASAVVPGAAQSLESLRHRAKIVPAKRPLQCVPYAREISGIEIRGNAWTWWKAAKGRYRRGQTPEVGAVLVMKKTRRLRYGHLAVVRETVNSRVIIVDQANWLNRGRIHLNTAVVDVSRNNDWSAVRVWYTPGGRLGSGTYSAYGFIYGDGTILRRASLDSLPLPRRRPDRSLSGNRIDSDAAQWSAQWSAQWNLVPRRAPLDARKATARPKPPATSVVNHILRMREG